MASLAFLSTWPSCLPFFRYFLSLQDSSEEDLSDWSAQDSFNSLLYVCWLLKIWVRHSAVWECFTIRLATTVLNLTTHPKTSTVLLSHNKSTLTTFTTTISWPLWSSFQLWALSYAESSLQGLRILRTNKNGCEGLDLPSVSTRSTSTFASAICHIYLLLCRLSTSEEIWWILSELRKALSSYFVVLGWPYFTADLKTTLLNSKKSSEKKWLVVTDSIYFPWFNGSFHRLRLSSYLPRLMELLP